MDKAPPPLTLKAPLELVKSLEEYATGAGMSRHRAALVALAAGLEALRAGSSTSSSGAGAEVVPQEERRRLEDRRGLDGDPPLPDGVEPFILRRTPAGALRAADDQRGAERRGAKTKGSK